MTKPQLSKKRIIAIRVLIGVIVALMIPVILFVVSYNNNSKSSSDAASISSYQECADAGYPIQTSFPEVCAVPGGKSFTNN